MKMTIRIRVQIHLQEARRFLASMNLRHLRQLGANAKAPPEKSATLEEMDNVGFLDSMDYDYPEMWESNALQGNEQPECMECNDESDESERDSMDGVSLQTQLRMKREEISITISMREDQRLINISRATES